jgi:hypothetical protein
MLRETAEIKALVRRLIAEIRQRAATANVGYLVAAPGRARKR